MLKLRVALGLAVVAAVLTAVFGLVQGARPLTVLYRSMVSLAGFTLAGYLAGTMAESFLGRRLAGFKAKGKRVDIMSKEGIIDNDELLNPSHATPQFSPLGPENFEHITVK